MLLFHYSPHPSIRRHASPRYHLVIAFFCSCRKAQLWHVPLLIQWRARRAGVSLTMSTSMQLFRAGACSWYVSHHVFRIFVLKCLEKFKKIEAPSILPCRRRCGGVTRYGQPCWFGIEGVSDIAVNDSFMLEAAIYHLLKSHFHSESYYVISSTCSMR
jgi:hypothetical protein